VKEDRCKDSVAAMPIENGRGIEGQDKRCYVYTEIWRMADLYRFVYLDGKEKSTKSIGTFANRGNAEKNPGLGFLVKELRLDLVGCVS
jgi:hypothetical protein